MKRRTPEHPKTYDLAEKLGIRRPCAVGYLEMLWHFAAEYAPQGNIGKYSDARIEAACDWDGGRGKLIRALIEVHWIEENDPHRLILHDWHDHADDAVRKRLHRSGLDFLTYPAKVTGQSAVSDRILSASRARSAKPSLAKPSQAPPAAVTVSDGQEQPVIAAAAESPPPVDIAGMARRKDLTTLARRPQPPPWPDEVPHELRKSLAALKPDDDAIRTLWRDCRIRDPNALPLEVAYLCAMRGQNGGLRRADNPIGLLIATIPRAFADGGNELLREFRLHPPEGKCG